MWNYVLTVQLCVGKKYKKKPPPLPTSSNQFFYINHLTSSDEKKNPHPLSHLLFCTQHPASNMARSISSSFLAVLALTLVVLQGVLAFVDPGRYLIQTEENEFLSVGPVPLVYPPIDVPARILDRRFYDEAWEVVPVEGGYTIRQPGNRPDTYGLVRKDDGAIFASARSKPQTWAVNKAGDNLFTIGSVNEDRLFTQYKDAFPSVILQPADGSGAQRWKFTRIDRDSHVLSGMYGKSRFNVQCDM